MTFRTGIIGPMTPALLSERKESFRQSFLDYLDKAHYAIPGEDGLSEADRKQVAQKAANLAVQHFFPEATDESK